MQENDFPIESSTKVSELLDRYPQLEELLIELAPPFAKLRNPLLRKSVAKVASLGQAAAVAGVPTSVIVNILREATGQELLEETGEDIEAGSYFSERPEWFDSEKVAASIDEIGDRHEDTMPLVRLNEKVNQIRSSEIVELITTYLPAPGIDIMKNRGFQVWCTQERPQMIRTYFRKP